MNFADILHKMIPRDKKTGSGNEGNADNVHNIEGENDGGSSTHINNIKGNKLGLFKLSVKRYIRTEKKCDKVTNSSS